MVSKKKKKKEILSSGSAKCPPLKKLYFLAPSPPPPKKNKCVTITPNLTISAYLMVKISIFCTLPAFFHALRRCPVIELWVEENTRSLSF